MYDNNYQLPVCEPGITNVCTTCQKALSSAAWQRWNHVTLTLTTVYLFQDVHHRHTNETFNLPLNALHWLHYTII